MSKHLEYINKKLPYSFRVINEVNDRKHRRAESYKFVENFLNNVLGDPLLVLTASRWGHLGYHYVRNPKGLWVRHRNVFYFKETKHMALARLHLHPDLSITKKLI